MVRKTKKEAAETCDKILNAATGVFACKGFNCTSLEDIAQAADVTRGAVYWHFKNKVEIFDVLYQELYNPLTEMILNDLEQDHPAPLQQLKDLCIKMLLDLETNPRKRQTLTLFLLKCDYSGELEPYKDCHQTQKSEKLKLFSRYFEKAIIKQTLPDNAAPDILSLSIVCYMKGIIIEYLNNPDAFDLPTQAPALINLFFGNFEADQTWRTRRDSNPRPLPSEGSALSS